MRLFWLIVLIGIIGINAKGLFKFKSETLKTFNGARRLLASGSLKTLVDLINAIAEKLSFIGLPKDLKIPEFGPAANMHKLKWSPKLEHIAFDYVSGKSELQIEGFRDTHHKGFEGFEWKGVLIEIAQEVLKLIPIEEIQLVMKPVLNILDKFLTALLLLVNYPGEQPMDISKNLGATQALFGHRYEIGCYANIIYSACFMEPSRNGGWLYQPGIPCTNCTTHCEFFEDNNGVIEEGDLCEAPPDESNSTAAFVVPQTSVKSHSFETTYNILFMGFIIGCVAL
ncbi:unnamed protein product [Caenorhabditis brenneri]